MESIYLDHAATTPVTYDVLQAMNESYQEAFGNPSSIHGIGRLAHRYLEQARHTLATSLDAEDKEIILTSGGTEADNLALLGTAYANRGHGSHIITTTQEHHAVLNTAQHLEQQGFRVTYLPVSQDGRVNVEDVRNALTEDTILVSVMMVNNETGMMQPIREIAALLRDHQAYFHTDAVQAYGLLDLSVRDIPVDLLSTSAHKMNGPKGIGFLYVRQGTVIEKQQFGGEQERKRRAGTENVANAVGFQIAVEQNMQTKEARRYKYETYRQLFLDVLTQEGIDYQINGELRLVAPSILNVSFSGMQLETLLTNFDLAGVAASSGSACTAGSVEPSHVLIGMFGAEHARVRNSIRFSFGTKNTEENVKIAAKRVAAIVNRLRSN